MADVVGVMMTRPELERRLELIRLDEQTARERKEQLEAELKQVEAILQRCLGMRQECEYWLNQQKDMEQNRSDP